MSSRSDLDLLFEPRSRRYVHVSITEKHTPHYIASRIILRLSTEQRKRNVQILDVGSGPGLFAEQLREYLKDHGISSHIVCIDIDEDAILEAQRRCDEAYLVDVEQINNVNDILKERKFHFILYLDVLEHLKRPDIVLSYMRKHHCRDSYTIASIPNICYWLIRLKVLIGRFEYEDIGILDKTHLRFFTHKTAIELFSEEWI